MSQHAPLVIDLSGPAITDDDRRRVQHPLVGGVIHFARHFQSRAQITAVNAELKRLRPDLLIAVDHEGGRVQRFKSHGFTHLPPMRRLGELWMDDGRGDPAASAGRGAMRALGAAQACGFVMGAELRACGVDLSFAPVLDLDWGSSGVIGDRALHADPRVVSVLGQALCLGLAQAGMAGCGKHFPGHGHVRADSHLASPIDRRSRKALLGTDALPFRALAGSLGAVMPAHVVYSKVDARPAGFSRVWLQDLLRGEFGFTGAVFSDDLMMEGARHLDGQPCSTTQAALAALEAGCDMALLCYQSQDGGAGVDELIDGLARAQIEGRWQPDPASETRRLRLLPSSAMPDWDDLMVDERYLAALERLP